MTGPDDRLAHLRQRLAELDEAPLSAHAEVLEQAHRALVEELERLERLDQPAGHGTESHAEEGGPSR